MGMDWKREFVGAACVGIVWLPRVNAVSAAVNVNIVSFFIIEYLLSAAKF